VLIERVLPGGAAERAGLHGGSQRAYLGFRPIVLGGDLIVDINGEPITTKQDLSNALNEHHAGDTVTVTVVRGQRRFDVKVTLSDASQQQSSGEET
jgi:S1-C subfamily serine protease